MEEITTIIGVVVLFALRIGVPMMVLVGLGMLIDRWQRNREANVSQQFAGDD